MPAPTTADELLDFVQMSGLVEEPKLRAYTQKLRDAGALPTDPTKLAQLLVRDAVLTYFQAEQLLQGKYKRFSLGKYKVLERLGQGGMGTVFLCEHKLMRRRVAVKVLPLAKAEDSASLARFQREARAAAQVDHPNIVRAFDIDQDENLHFLVMEWVDGINLQDLVKKSGPLDVARACHYVYGAAAGLQYAHEIGLLHRDIKPGNILVDRVGLVKILDLGLARLTHDTDDNLTRQNDENVLGTADYLAPEQAIDSHTVDIRADIYSLGATLYFLLTGSQLFPEGSVAQKLIWHQTRAPRPLRSLRPEVPEALAAVVEKMVAKEPAQRYQTPAEVMVGLGPWVATPIPPPAEREIPALAPAVAGPGSRAAAGAGPASLAAPLPRPAGGGPSTFTGVVPAAGVAPAAAGPGHEPAVWSTLDTDTKDAAPGDTQRPEPADIPDEDEPPPRRQPAQAGGGKGKVLALVAALVLTGAAVGTYFAFFNKGNQTNPAQNKPGAPGRKITVDKGGGEGSVATLREALAKAGPGDTIAVVEPRLVEPALKLDRNRHKDVTVEGATGDGKPPVIEYLGPPGAKGGIMLDGGGLEGFRVKNLEFDGKGAADVGIRLNGISPVTTVEGVTVRNVTRAGVHLSNLTGLEGRPVALDRVRVLLAPTAEAVLIEGKAADTRFVTIKNCRFEGAGRGGVRVDGAALDFEIHNNRFYNLAGPGIVFAKLPPGQAARPTKGAITNNSFYQMPTGLQFDGPPPELEGYAVKVSLNYFAKTGAVLKASGPLKNLAAADNFAEPASGPGAPPLALTRHPTPLPDPNPNDDAAFLRFPTNAPTAAGNRAGVN